MAVLRLALKGVRHRWRKYALLAGALSFCFAVVLVLGGLSSAMTRNVREAASRRYGGDLFILGHQQTPYYTPVIRDHEALLQAVKQSGIETALVTRRTSYFENGNVFFNGYSARQKVVTGIDWEAEAGRFSGLDFVSSGLEGMAGSRGILISSQTAKQLKARAGDDVILEADTGTGQRNTVRLVVRGIFRDASIFGAYVSYVDLGVLNHLIGLEPEEYTILGIYLRDPASAARDSARLYAALSDRVPLFGPVRTQQDLWVKLGERWSGVKCAVLTLEGYLADVRDLTSAVDLGRDLLLAMMGAVIILGISNTYRVMVHDRTREFGTLRAIGVQRGGVLRLIIAETLLLSLLSIAVGSAIGFSLLQALGSISYPRIPGFDIFLSRGRLGWHIPPAVFLLDAVLLICAALLGGLIPAQRASRVEPARALRLDA